MSSTGPLLLKLIILVRPSSSDRSRFAHFTSYLQASKAVAMVLTSTSKTDGNSSGCQHCQPFDGLNGLDSEIPSGSALSLSSSQRDRATGADRSDREENTAQTFSSASRSLTYINCLALVLGLQIGSGIFSAPAVVSSRVPSPGAGVSIWAFAGGLVWTGAASFIELGTTVPKNGGIQEYLRYCYGDVYGFLFAWIWIFLVKPCAMAMVALIFSEYLYETISVETSVATWVLKGTALLGITFVTILNCIGTRMGVGAANAFMGIKLLGLSSIAMIGLAYRLAGLKTRESGLLQAFKPPNINATTRPQSHVWGLSSIWTDSADLTDALFAALFAYGGWESVSIQTSDTFLRSPF